MNADSPFHECGGLLTCEVRALGGSAGRSRTRSRPGELAHPFVAVDADERRHALEHLIRVEQYDDHNRREVPDECGEVRQRQHDDPDADDIDDHDELRIAAAADDAAVDGHLVRHRDQHHALDDHVGVGERARLVRDVVDAQHRNADDEQRRAEDQADRDEHHLQRARILANALHAAVFADGLADDDRCGGGRAGPSGPPSGR